MKTELIAEIGQAHDGSLGIAHSYIDRVAQAGLKHIKFQTHIAQAESSEHEQFRIKFSYEDKTRYDYWKRMEFTEEQWRGLKQHCDEVGIEFFSSPFSVAAVRLLDRIGVQRFKLGSGETDNYLIMDAIRKTGKPLMISTGMSLLSEIDATMEYLKGIDVSIFQCTTEYPTSIEHIPIRNIGFFKERYGVEVGLSDHSGSIYPLLLAVALGAGMLEFHVTFNKSLFGPDSTSSLDFAQVAELVAGVKAFETMLSLPVGKYIDKHQRNMQVIFKKSLAVNRDMVPGDRICFDDLESKRPVGYGMSTHSYKAVLGRTVQHRLKKWSFLNEGDFV